MDEDSSTEQKTWQVSKRKDMRSECQVKASDVFCHVTFWPTCDFIHKRFEKACDSTDSSC